MNEDQPNEDTPHEEQFDESLPTKRNGSGSSGGQTDFRVNQPITRIGRYEVDSQLGKGGFGFVYLARDPLLSRKVAIKVPRWDRPLDEGSISRFLHEGQMLAQLAHPSIVSIYDVGVSDDGIPFVVMQFVEGRSLSQIMREGPLGIDRILNLMLQVARALQVTHQNGLVHRDFKPSNVIVDAQDTIRLVDFGLALHEDLSPSDINDSNIVGTPGFMAPEQLRGENHLIDGQTDIWAFGVTLYVLVTGKVPFKGTGFRELARVVCYKNPRPMRQIDSKIPRELERICFRCLEKLIEDRYRSMADVIEELEAFQDSLSSSLPVMASTKLPPTLAELSQISESPSKPDPGLPSGSNSQGSQPNSTTLSHDSQLRMIPKGLRAFDQNDHDFFLTLLPGPKDRHGVPESVRFWQARLCPQQQIEDIAVGLIYGPSGCGKSSFIRAALIPQLSQGVVPIYFDCATDRLELRLAERITREIHTLPGSLSLAEIIRELRVGNHLRGDDRVLLILDQFEQWLSQNDRFEMAELTQALRQCDSRHVQAVLLVRDEFWLKASLFMKSLDLRIEESRNSMSLPLFDLRHARRVLEAYGRAYQALPPEPEILSRSQKKFIETAINELAQNGRVICVHLAVFAETMKDRPWEFAQLKQLGGWQGIGREYIAGIFNNPETPEFIKRHSTEAWQILRQLLPFGSEPIKGKAQTRSTLAANSQILHRNRFDEILHFLQSDSGLITAVDAERDHDDDNEISNRMIEGHLALTHDFLVEPIRAWGSAKQNETSRGRATSHLGQLSNQWRTTRDNRFLPSAFEYCRLRLLVSQPENVAGADYWRKARSRTWFQSGILATVFLLGWGLWFVVRQSQVKFENKTTVERYLDAPAAEFNERWTEASRVPADSWLSNAADSDDFQRRIRALALLCETDSEKDVHFRRLLEDLGSADSEDLPVFLRALSAVGDQADGVLREVLTTASEPLDRARLSILLGLSGDLTALRDVLTLSANPTARTMAQLDFKNWDSDFDHLIGAVTEQDLQSSQGDLLSGLSWSIATPGHLSANPTRMAFLKDVFLKSPSGGAHYTAQYGLEQHKIPLPEVVTRPADADWMSFSYSGKVTKQTFELYFVRIRAGSYPLGSGYSDFAIPESFQGYLKGQVDQDYWIQVNEIPAGLIAEFMHTIDDGHPVLTFFYQQNPTAIPKELQRRREPIDVMSPSEDGLWLELCQEFCVWFGAELGVGSPYGEIDPEKLPGVYRLKADQPGMRLPTFDEFELALRAKSQTKYFFGEDPQWLGDFIGYGTEPDPKNFRSLPPNGFGCFEMVSNALEWVESKVRNPNDRTFSAIVRGSNLKQHVDEFASANFSDMVTHFNFAHASFRLVILEPIHQYR